MEKLKKKTREIGKEQRLTNLIKRKEKQKKTYMSKEQRQKVEINQCK